MTTSLHVLNTNINCVIHTILSTSQVFIKQFWLSTGRPLILNVISAARQALDGLSSRVALTLVTAVPLSVECSTWRSPQISCPQMTLAARQPLHSPHQSSSKMTSVTARQPSDDIGQATYNQPSLRHLQAALWHHLSLHWGFNKQNIIVCVHLVNSTLSYHRLGVYSLWTRWSWHL